MLSSAQCILDVTAMAAVADYAAARCSLCMVQLLQQVAHCASRAALCGTTNCTLPQQTVLMLPVVAIIPPVVASCTVPSSCLPSMSVVVSSCKDNASFRMQFLIVMCGTLAPVMLVCRYYVFLGPLIVPMLSIAVRVSSAAVRHHQRWQHTTSSLQLHFAA
jgi:hypothetical protein